MIAPVQYYANSGTIINYCSCHHTFVSKLNKLYNGLLFMKLTFDSC